MQSEPGLVLHQLVNGDLRQHSGRCAGVAASDPPVCLYFDRPFQPGWVGGPHDLVSKSFVIHVSVPNHVSSPVSRRIEKPSTASGGHLLGGPTRDAIRHAPSPPKTGAGAWCAGLTKFLRRVWSMSHNTPRRQLH